MYPDREAARSISFYFIAPSDVSPETACPLTVSKARKQLNLGFCSIKAYVGTNAFVIMEKLSCQLSLRYSRLRIASRRAAFAPLSALSGSELSWPADSSSLQSGHRLAKPGFPGLSSNSSPHTTQVLIGYAIRKLFQWDCVASAAPESNMDS